MIDRRQLLLGTGSNHGNRLHFRFGRFEPCKPSDSEDYSMGGCLQFCPKLAKYNLPDYKRSNHISCYIITELANGGLAPAQPNMNYMHHLNRIHANAEALRILQHRFHSGVWWIARESFFWVHRRPVYSLVRSFNRCVRAFATENSSTRTHGVQDEL